MIRGATWRPGGHSPPRGGWKKRRAGVTEVAFRQEGAME
jgi:hypothetical protein